MKMDVENHLSPNVPTSTLSGSKLLEDYEANMTSMKPHPADDVLDPVQEVILSRQRARVLVFALLAVIVPALAFLGLLGNVMSICVLRLHGLDKSYNIMLIALACSDSSYLISVLVYGLVAVTGFRYPHDNTAFTTVLFEILRVLDNAGACTSFSIPILITAERLLAVFFPLQVSRIVSPLKALLVVGTIFVGQYTTFTYFVTYNMLIGKNQYSNATLVESPIIELAILQNNSDSTVELMELYRFLFGPFPVICVFTGCVVLGVKIKLTSLKRKKMTSTSSQTSTSRVTATLLVVCLIYTLTSTLIFFLHTDVMLAAYVPRDKNGMMGIVLGEVANLAAGINCSTNFLIYVVINKKFRETYVGMISRVFTRRR